MRNEHCKTLMLGRLQGIWTAPLIDNPDFVDDKELYKLPPIKYVGFELWQVKAGTIFDNILLTDSLAEAMTLAQDTWGKSKDAEKEMFAAVKVRHVPVACLTGSCALESRSGVAPCNTCLLLA